MTKIKEYVNIQLGKHYHLFTLQKYNPKELQNNLNDTRSKQSFLLLLFYSNSIFLQPSYSSSSLLRIPSYLYRFLVTLFFLFTHPQVYLRRFLYHYFYFVIENISLCQLSKEFFLLKFGYKMKIFHLKFFFFSFSCFLYF